MPRLLWMRVTSPIRRFCNHCQKEGGGRRVWWWVLVVMVVTVVVLGVVCFSMLCVAIAAPHQFHRFDPRFSSHSLPSVRSVASATE